MKNFKTNRFDILLFQKDINEITKDDFFNISKSKSFDFASKILDNIYNQKNTNELEFLFEQFNYYLDEIIDENLKEFNKFYNIVLFKFLSDFTYHKNKDFNNNEIFNKLINNNDNISKVLIALHKYGAISHSALADKLNISRPNLSNTIKKISEYDNVLTTYKLPSNNKTIYYNLSIDFKRTISKNRRQLPFQYNNPRLFNGRFEAEYTI